MWVRSQGASLDVTLCSCSRCSNCGGLVYDEDVHAGWTCDDYNLSSTCPYCAAPFLPSLKITISRRVVEARSSWYVPITIDFIEEETSVDTQLSLEDLQNFSVPFISPLALRRELESRLVPDALFITQASLRITHPIIFWNLLYYNRRLELPSHILAWIAPTVHIRCVYAAPALHMPEELPLYFVNHQDLSACVINLDPQLWQSVIDALQQSNLFLILKYIIGRKREQSDLISGIGNHFSIYRDILFVALDRFSRNVDREQFDSQYYYELGLLPPMTLSQLSVKDFLPRPIAVACKRVFLPLDIM